MKNCLSTAMVAAAVFVLAVGASPARASEYPDRPIKIVVAYPPGGATDVMARAVARRLGERLKQNVIIENRPGASGQIGTAYVAKAAADGYTLIFTAADTHSINPHVYPKIAYDSRRDFTPVAQVGYLPMALIVSPTIEAKDLQQFISLAKRQPGKLTYATYGIGSSSHVAMEMLKAHSGIELLHVPFQGAAPAVTAVMGGQVDALMVPITVAEPQHRAGKVRLIGIAAPARFPAAQDLPTFAEQGIALSAAPWIGILAPANVPMDIVEKLNREVGAALDPQVRETLVKNGLVPETLSQADFKAFLDAEYERWGKTVREANIRAD